MHEECLDSVRANAGYVEPLRVPRALDELFPEPPCSPLKEDFQPFVTPVMPDHLNAKGGSKSTVSKLASNL